VDDGCGGGGGGSGCGAPASSSLAVVVVVVVDVEVVADVAVVIPSSGCAGVGSGSGAVRFGLLFLALSVTMPSANATDSVRFLPLLRADVAGREEDCMSKFRAQFEKQQPYLTSKLIDRPCEMSNMYKMSIIKLYSTNLLSKIQFIKCSIGAQRCVLCERTETVKISKITTKQRFVRFFDE
jgi:hypothetical protein